MSFNEIIDETRKVFEDDSEAVDNIVDFIIGEKEQGKKIDTKYVMDVIKAKYPSLDVIDTVIARLEAKGIEVGQ